MENIEKMAGEPFIISVQDHDEYDQEKLQEFFLDKDNQQNITLDSGGKPINFSLVAKTDEVYFGKRVIAIKKLVRREVKAAPNGLTVPAGDKYIEWQEVVMKKAVQCAVIGHRQLDNGIRVAEMQTTFSRIPSHFKKTGTVMAMLVVQDMHKTPFLIPYPTK